MVVDAVEIEASSVVLTVRSTDVVPLPLASSPSGSSADPFNEALAVWPQKETTKPSSLIFWMSASISYNERCKEIDKATPNISAYNSCFHDNNPIAPGAKPTRPYS